MTKKLVIVAALMTLCGGFVSAQDGTSSSGMSISTNNKIQVSLCLGNSMMFNQDLSYVLPEYGNPYDGNTNFGIGSTSGNKSNDPGYYLNFKELGSNSLVNMAGIQIHYFATDFLDVNLMFGMDIRKTPQKDFVEGVNAGNAGIAYISGQQYIEGQLLNNWFTNIGANYHIATSNDKVDLYAGIQAGYQQGRIKTFTPYTGKEWYDNSIVYVPNDRAGQVHCITGAIVAGVAYNFVPGFSLGFEFAPCNYQYSLLEVIPTGQGVYQAENHAWKIFSCPMLKLGIRF